MNSTFSKKALAMIDAYEHFTLGSINAAAICSVPYYNNKVNRHRAAFRAYIGKGTPDEIREEVISLAKKDHINIGGLNGEQLKKFLVENNLGIDCSGFAYHILSAEKPFKYTKAGGILHKMRASLRPAENCDVATLADDANSQTIPVRDIKPGDMITILAKEGSNTERADRDHILVVYKVDTDSNGAPSKIYYAHAVMNPEDGQYGSGIKKSGIIIIDSSKPVTEQKWTNESDYRRSSTSNTELRRLKT